MSAYPPAPPLAVDWTRARAALSTVALLGVETVISLGVMFGTGLLVCVVSGPYEDLLSVVGWVFWSAVFAVVTTGAVLVVGLPLRLARPLRSWWERNGEVMLLGVLVGVALVVGAFVAGHPGTVNADGVELAVYEPQWVLLLAGWVVLAFSCAYVRWPRRWTPRRTTKGPTPA
ncbi:MULTISPECIES: hypothetical protein [unclassified Isoptericola]|uniref:hypothetical protein n=1 Tax=unclassified Isoptericola TaxID=2623355 RepID=UPI00365FEDC5